MTTPALEVRDASIRFGDAAGLEGVEFAVSAGERLVVLGASGAGKTTLLRAVAGLAPLARGTVHVGGRDVTFLPPERRDVVYLHQTPVLFPHLSVGGNVAFPLRVRRRPQWAIDEEVTAALAMMRLEGFERRDPASLSGGQRHRVALARAIAARPSVLLLDEPLSSLDPALREDVRAAIVAVGSASRAGQAVPGLVLVTHDLDDAALLGDRIAVLLERTLAQVDSPETLFARPASLAVARFLAIGSEIPGRIGADGRFESVLGAGVLHANGGMSAGPATAVVRPDAIRLVRGSEPTGVRVTVAQMRHRPHRLTAVVRIGESTMEATVDPHAAPLIGEHVGLDVDPRGVLLFPGV